MPPPDEPCTTIHIEIEFPSGSYGNAGIDGGSVGMTLSENAKGPLGWVNDILDWLLGKKGGGGGTSPTPPDENPPDETPPGGDTGGGGTEGGGTDGDDTGDASQSGRGTQVRALHTLLSQGMVTQVRTDTRGQNLLIRFRPNRPRISKITLNGYYALDRRTAGRHGLPQTAAIAAGTYHLRGDVLRLRLTETGASVEARAQSRQVGVSKQDRSKGKNPDASRQRRGATAEPRSLRQRSEPGQDRKPAREARVRSPMPRPRPSAAPR